MLVAINALTKKSGRGAAEGPSCEHHAVGMKKVSALGAGQRALRRRPEFKREFKELMDFWDIEKQVTRGHAYGAHHPHHQENHVAPRGSQSGPAASSGTSSADILSQINGRKHATTRWRRTLPALTPKWQRLLCATSNAGQAQGDPPEIKVGTWFGSGLSRSKQGLTG